MSDNLLVLVGKIVAMQGVHGDVRVQTYTEKPADFAKLKILGSGFGDGDFRFVRALPNSNVIIAHVRGFEDRTVAEKLRGTELFVERSSLPDVNDGEYYQADLIGFVVMRDGQHVGILAGFQNFGAGDIIETKTGDMFSFRDAVVDFENKTVTVK